MVRYFKVSVVFIFLGFLCCVLHKIQMKEQVGNVYSIHITITIHLWSTNITEVLLWTGRYTSTLA